MPANPQNILVILLSEMGSVVLSGPMFANLKKQYPNAAIHLLQLNKNQEVARMLRLVDENCLHSVSDKGLFSFMRDSIKVIRRFRALKIDAIIDCELFSRISVLYAFASGAPIISGFSRYTQEGLYRGNFITHPVAYNPYQHISKQFLTLADVLTSHRVMPRQKESPIRSTPTDPCLSVPFSPEELSAYRATLFSTHPIAQDRSLVLLYVGGGILPERAWPLTHYAQLAKGLCIKGYVIAVIGLTEDASLAKELLLQCNSSLCIDLTGHTKNLRELLMLMHTANLLITNDGGPGHFATLTSIKSIVFFGPETGKLYAPLGSNTWILESGLSCSPCLTAYNHRNTYCDGDNTCLKAIEPSTVLDISLSLLE